MWKENKSANHRPVELMSSKQMLAFWDEKHLPKPPLYWNPVVQDIFLAQNIARTHPKLFCKKVLSKLESRFEEEYYYDMRGYGIKVAEGIEALTEWIDSLQHREPVMPLEWNRDLSDAAKDHVKDIGKNGLLGHESSSGLGVYDRILMNNDNQAVGMWAENIVYESIHPVEIVALMLINDGDSLRPQRENALDAAHQYVGIDFGGHVFKYSVTVLDYWKEYIDDNKMFEMKNGIYDYEQDELEYEELE